MKERVLSTHVLQQQHPSMLFFHTLNAALSMSGSEFVYCEYFGNASSNPMNVACFWW
jgi:hypothetical protein